MKRMGKTCTSLGNLGNIELCIVIFQSMQSDYESVIPIVLYFLSSIIARCSDVFSSSTK